MFKPAISNKLISFGGAVLFLGFLGTAWFPRSCPVLKEHLIGCTQYRVLNEPKTEIEKELVRLPSQLITSSASFSAKSEENRTTTVINFNYLPKNPEKAISFLQIKQDNQFKNIALVTHPLLLDLKWQVISETNGVYLYQRNGDQDSIQTFLSSNFNSTKLAVDQVAAETLALKPNQYTQLEPLESTDQLDYIITSRPPTINNGRWYLFSRKFDLSSTTVSSENKIEGMIVPFVNGIDQAFHLTEIHIDYAKRN